MPLLMDYGKTFFPKKVDSKIIDFDNRKFTSLLTTKV